MVGGVCWELGGQRVRLLVKMFMTPADEFCNSTLEKGYLRLKTTTGGAIPACGEVALGKSNQQRWLNANVSGALRLKKWREEWTAGLLSLCLPGPEPRSQHRASRRRLTFTMRSSDLMKKTICRDENNDFFLFRIIFLSKARNKCSPRGKELWVSLSFLLPSCIIKKKTKEQTS